MVGDDEGNVALQLSAMVPVEQVLKAVIELGDEDDHARAVAGVSQPPLHLELFGDGGEPLHKFRKIEVELRRIKLNSRQKQI